MQFLKKVFVAIPVTLLLAFICMGLVIYFDLTERSQDLDTYIRLAMRDALINVQTTEENGLDFTKGNSSYDAAVSRQKYRQYLAALDSETAHLGRSAEDTMHLLHTFLDNNQSATGDAMFRPIQFGMTYVDPEMFSASFKESLTSLVEANYGAGSGSSRWKTTCNDALHVYLDNMNSVVHINGPHIVEFDADNNVLRQLYGTDRAETFVEDAISGMENAGSLGISTASTPKFYVYYDITVTVPWGSSTALPLLSKNFFTLHWAGTSFEYNEKADPSNDDELQYLRMHSDSMVKTYTYRYILLN